MTRLVLLIAAFTLLPSIGVLAALAVGYSIDRYNDRRWARDFTEWETEL